jgi:type IV pilus assembly protein PilQ
VKRLLGFKSCLVGSALVALAAQAAQATATTITGVQVSPTETGVRITLATDETANTPQVFAINQGNSLRADIVRTELKLQNGSQFTQRNPAPGIDEIALVPLDAHSVRLTVDGSNHAPISSVTEAANGDIVIDVNTASIATPASTPVPSELVTVPGEAPQLAQAQPQPDPPADAGPAQTTDQPDVLVPNPEVVIDGIPVTTPQEVQVAPPFLPRAVAPPVGDIAVSEGNPIFSNSVDLGTSERVPRLVLRNAPAREVLSLLARSAGLNLIFIDPEGGEGPLVTLDIQNESVQDSFNGILRITGLRVSRVGRTIYVGEELPTSARNVSSRTLRLNQVDSATAAAFLASLGAESTQVVNTTTTNVTEVDSGFDLGDGGGGTRTVETVTSTEISALAYTPPDGSQAPQVLEGLFVASDTRLNAVTLIGEPQLIETATSYLVQLDLRRRQVAVNVRIINIDLNATNSFGTSFSFLLDDNAITNTAGFGLINLGSSVPAAAAPNPGTFGVPSVIAGSNPLANIANQFLAQLQAQVTNGNAKVLTDPTLVIQEGQSAGVLLAEEVLTSVESTIDADTNVTTITPELTPAGLALSIDVNRIDDNGFVTLNIGTEISAPDEAIIFTDVNGNAQTITPLNLRAVNSGEIRVRDGQTLVIAGIIQESDRTTVRKVPILGDLPLLGALFRSSVDENSRTEVIVLLTPQVLDDSDESVWGYGYSPSEEIQDLINRSPEPGQ